MVQNEESGGNAMNYKFAEKHNSKFLSSNKGTTQLCLFAYL